jgi:hypothetical protein
LSDLPRVFFLLAPSSLSLRLRIRLSTSRADRAQTPAAIGKVAIVGDSARRRSH